MENTATPLTPDELAARVARARYDDARERQHKAELALEAALRALQQATRDVLAAQVADPTQTDEQVRAELLALLAHTRHASRPITAQVAHDGLTFDAALRLLQDQCQCYTTARASLRQQ